MSAALAVVAENPAAAEILVGGLIVASAAEVAGRPAASGLVGKLLRAGIAELMPAKAFAATGGFAGAAGPALAATKVTTRTSLADLSTDVRPLAATGRFTNVAGLALATAKVAPRLSAALAVVAENPASAEILVGRLIVASAAEVAGRPAASGLVRKLLRAGIAELVLTKTFAAAGGLAGAAGPALTVADLPADVRPFAATGGFTNVAGLALATAKVAPRLSAALAVVAENPASAEILVGRLIVASAAEVAGRPAASGLVRKLLRAGIAEVVPAKAFAATGGFTNVALATAKVTPRLFAALAVVAENPAAAEILVGGLVVASAAEVAGGAAASGLVGKLLRAGIAELMLTKAFAAVESLAGAAGPALATPKVTKLSADVRPLAATGGFTNVALATAKVTPRLCTALAVVAQNPASAEILVGGLVVASAAEVAGGAAASGLVRKLLRAGIAELMPAKAFAATRGLAGAAGPAATKVTTRTAVADLPADVRPFTATGGFTNVALAATVTPRLSAALAVVAENPASAEILVGGLIVASAAEVAELMPAASGLVGKLLRAGIAELMPAKAFAAVEGLAITAGPALAATGRFTNVAGLTLATAKVAPRLSAALAVVTQNPASAEILVGRLVVSSAAEVAELMPAASGLVGKLLRAGIAELMFTKAFATVGDTTGLALPARQAELLLAGVTAAKSA
ncbi:MAG: hypothetical protein AB7J86_41840 [Vulcanimicrobiota bacterium]